MTEGSTPTPAGADERRLADGQRDALVREEPLVLQIDGESLVTMRTPGHDLDLALGFVLSEGLAASSTDVVRLDFRKGIPLNEPGRGPQGEIVLADRVHVGIRGGVPPARRGVLLRQQEVRPSCGICGIEDFGELVAATNLQTGLPKVTSRELEARLGRLRGEQRLFDATGGCHAAALFHEDGTLLGFGEDVGRHNALDKAIGAAARTNADLQRSVALLSGRAGYELVAKLLRVGCPFIVSISAASALAFDLCRESGATLVGFARSADCKVYCDDGRFESRP